MIAGIISNNKRNFKLNLLANIESGISQAYIYKNNRWQNPDGLKKNTGHSNIYFVSLLNQE